jgi:hypothetical protein
MNANISLIGGAGLLIKGAVSFRQPALNQQVAEKKRTGSRSSRVEREASPASTRDTGAKNKKEKRIQHVPCMGRVSRSLFTVFNIISVDRTLRPFVSSLGEDDIRIERESNEHVHQSCGLPISAGIISEDKTIRSFRSDSNQAE